MSEVYVFDKLNNRYPSMSKEQILAAIAQAVEAGEIKDVDAGFVTTVKEQNKATGLKFWVGTQAEYNAIAEKETNCFYIVTDDTFGDDVNKAVEDMQSKIEEMTAKLTAVAIESTEYKGCFFRLASNGEQEWLNPPMITGVEYRTTERVGNRPVYVKLLKFKTAEVGGHIDTNIVWTTHVQEISIIEVSGKFNSAISSGDAGDGNMYMFPAFENDGTLAASILVSTYEDDEQYFWHIRQYTHTQLAENSHATVVVKYTRE